MPMQTPPQKKVAKVALRQVMDQSFVLLRAEWTAEKALSFLTACR
jgi:hypothetical protein